VAAFLKATQKPQDLDTNFTLSILLYKRILTIFTPASTYRITL